MPPKMIAVRRIPFLFAALATLLIAAAPTAAQARKPACPQAKGVTAVVLDFSLADRMVEKRDPCTRELQTGTKPLDTEADVRGWWLGSVDVYYNANIGRQAATLVSDALRKSCVFDMYSRQDLRRYYMDKREVLEKQFTQLSDKEVDHALLALNPVKVGKQLGVDKVIVGRICDSELRHSRAFGYFTSAASLWVTVYDVKTGRTEFQQEYDRARREGHLDPASAWSLHGLERGSGGIANSYWGVMNHALGAVAEVTETVNRRATLFAALEGAKSMTQQQLARYGSAYDYAIQAIQETQGVMNKGNRPKWARGTAGSLLMVYKQFGIAYVEQLIRSIKNPMWRGQRDKWRRSMWMMLMMLWALAGSVGLPFAQNIADTVKGTLSAAGHPVQLDREFEKLVGNEAADFILNGAWNYANLGVDLQGRTSMGSLIPGTQLLDPSITDQSKQRAIAGFGGAAGGMVSDILDAFKNSFEGKPVEATINLAPRSIGSMIKAGQMYTTGKFTDSRGRLISDNVTMADVLTKALDGQPARLADIQRSRGMESQADALQASQRRKFKARIVEAVEKKDKEALREALADLDQWNKTRKEYPVKITRSEIKQALKKRQQDWTQRSPVRPETLKRVADSM